ncbi:unnamed protein product [Rotaria magnacalcarata]|uniref:Kinesin-like protein n=1 Tax=Rotaria magnacalcarata TaxID=392030 RepID=A0A815A5P5_9BILA|nr:unnamed protein product [Rotaria magnacalcarata]CAF1466597.1 unnamed protein product [Rotaria magnacalcarata]CAF3821116.1 unnamed protein product [Rotaria magnacalcarata]CAF3944555.1 unnamed protein product [Rotaria magnacalcarata]
MNRQRRNSCQGNCRNVNPIFKVKKNSERLSATSTNAFSKVAIRSNHRDVFIRAISRFLPLIRVTNCADISDRFTICARVRPFLEEETRRNDVYECVTTTDDSVTVHAGNLRLNKFEIKHTTVHLDKVFGKYSTNQDVYNVVRKVVAQSIPSNDMIPFDSTIFLYGKTGTGKSHTINGITERFAQDLFYLIENSQYDVRIGISAVEIVAGTKGFIVSKDDICDLYNKGALVNFRDDIHGAVHLRGAKEYACDDSTQLDMYIKRAMAIRRTQATNRNAESSRSHLIYYIRVRRANNILQDGDIISTITFVDLAGNEGQQDSLYHNENSDQIKDCASINRSLSTLQDCIRAAASESKVIPFRGSVLTRVLKKSFCSKESKTVFIGTISGLPMDAEQSVMTLRYIGLIKWAVEDFIVEDTVKLDVT